MPSPSTPESLHLEVVVPSHQTPLTPRVASRYNSARSSRRLPDSPAFSRSVPAFPAPFRHGFGMRVRQLALPIPNTWGGRRLAAGPWRRGPRPRVSHRTRPYHDGAHPSHVTLRAVSGLPSLRLSHVFPVLREAIARAQRGRAFRICHFSVQSNHVHMLVEAKSREALSRGVQGLAIRLARAINRVLARCGKVWADRYHRHDLATPREVKYGLVYVLQNVKKHQPGFAGLDPCSSAANREVAADPRTWLLRVGWGRAGAIGADDLPARRRRA
jgi:putative transposase